MPAKIGNITFDCSDALRLATFWAAVLGRQLDAGGDEGFATIGRSDPERMAAAWFFEKVPESKVAKNRLHLDLVDPEPMAVARLSDLGAAIVAEHEFGTQRWTVLLDPEGNEFCIAGSSYTG